MTASPATHGASEARFFFIMACVMGTVAISGFALMLAVEYGLRDITPGRNSSCVGLLSILRRYAFGGGDAASSSGSSLPRFRSDPSSNPMGPGETVRLDHVAISAKDPTPEDPTRWLEEEHAAFMAYVDRYARDYSVQFLADYFAEYAEAIRMSICNGNGVFVDGNATRAECACESNWVGVECEIPCLACVHGTCALSDDSQSATCVCDPGFAGELCDTPCPPCVWNNTVGGSAAAQGACYTNATGGGACRCAPGFGGAYCQHECPPCEYESTHPAGFEVLA